MSERNKSAQNNVNILNPQEELSRTKHRIGLVFDGGGAKGAYQVGVWKALRETGLEQLVTDIAGTSVGGLNAALFVKGDLEEAEHIWTKEINSICISRIQMGVEKLIDDHLSNMSFFEQKKSDHKRPINCFITICNKSTTTDDEFLISPDGKDIIKCTSGRAEYFNMRFLSVEERSEALRNATMHKDILLATSALPVLCRSIKIGKNHFEDGGMVDNSPVYPLLEATQCDTIIVVHLDADAKNYKKKSLDGVSILEENGVCVLNIAPSQDAGHFFGMLDFDTQKAKWLMNLGYNDAKKAFETIVRTWAKESMLTESGEKAFTIIEHMSLEDKYRLYNECEFLVRGNYAKLHYISEEGFGKTILRVIMGGGAKAKKQILENSVALQEKMMQILVCLDDEMQNMKQGMHYLFYRSLTISDVLIAQHIESTAICELLNCLIDQAEYNGKFLATKYPEYKLHDMSDLKRNLDKIKAGINYRISVVNEMNRQALEIKQVQVEATAKRISEAKHIQVLRLTPKSVFSISFNGIEEFNNEGPTADSKFTRYNIVDNSVIKKHLDLENKDYSAIILPEGNKHPTIKTIRPAEYYMYLWFINTPISEKAGKFVCMMDYYHNNMYIYGFSVSDDGKSYSNLQATKDNKIADRHSAKTIYEKIIEILDIKSIEDYLFFRTFETTRTGKGHFESRLDCTDYMTLKKVDSEWEQALGANDGILFVDFVDRFIKKVYE